MAPIYKFYLQIQYRLQSIIYKYQFKMTLVKVSISELILVLTRSAMSLCTVLPPVLCPAVRASLTVAGLVTSSSVSPCQPG